MHLSWLRAFLIVICTVSSVVDLSLATECSPGSYGIDCKSLCGHCKNKKCEVSGGNCTLGCKKYYLPPRCEKKLERPAFCASFWGLSILCYLSELNPDEKKNLRFQIKEESSAEWKIICNDCDTRQSASEIFDWRMVNSTTNYRVRAVLNETESPELKFDTNCQPSSAPPDFKVTYKGTGSLALEWYHEHDHRFGKCTTRLRNSPTGTTTLTLPLYRFMVDLFEDGKKMCDQYWPPVEGTLTYGDVIVSNAKQRVFAHYTYRTFWVTTRSRKEMRKVDHLQYTGWPAEGVPMYSHSVAEYLRKLMSIPTGPGPIVMHCSSGTGRTGAIILCDICLRHFAAEGTVDVFAEAKRMYKSRANMLHNFPQYVLPHLVPSHCLLLSPTKVPCNEISPQKMAEMKIDLSVHMERLDDCSWMEKALRPLRPLRFPHPENLLKNRFPKLAPVGDRLVTLTRYPTYDEHSSYISAVGFDGVRFKNQYVASQLPMPSTLTDFWRLIIEKNVELVVILQRPDPEDETCCVVVPHETTVVPMPYVKVERKMESKSSEHFTTDILLLTDCSVKPARARRITTLTCNKWSYGEGAKPPAPKALVELWLASENIRRVEGPTLVLCHNGVTGCGLYLALSFMLERMAEEQECDVILAVRAVRRFREEFVRSKSQFEYLYDAAVEYSEIFRIYANFR